MSFELVVTCFMLCGITVAQEFNETSIKYVNLSAILAPVNKLRKDVISAFGLLYIDGKALAGYDVPNRGVHFNALINKSEEIYQTGMTIVFPNVLLNEGNCYNATSGTFTAPSSGPYLFTAHACNNPTKKPASFAIIQNGIQLAQSILIAYNQHTCASAGAWVGLKAGDMVWVNSQIDDCFIYSSELNLPYFYGMILELDYPGTG